jgi:hypothetical protein
MGTKWLVMSVHSLLLETTVLDSLQTSLVVVVTMFDIISYDSFVCRRHTMFVCFINDLLSRLFVRLSVAPFRTLICVIILLNKLLLGMPRKKSTGRLHRDSWHQRK